MRSRKHRRLADGSIRGLALVLIAFLARALAPIELAVGVPGSAVRSPATAWEPAFACSKHACGCRTAEDCRRSCCCTEGAPRHAGDRRPTGPVYSACHGNGPHALPSRATDWTAILSSSQRLVDDVEKAGDSVRPDRAVSGPTIEPATPPPRAGSVRA